MLWLDEAKPPSTSGETLTALRKRIQELRTDVYVMHYDGVFGVTPKMPQALTKKQVTAVREVESLLNLAVKCLKQVEGGKNDHSNV